MAAEVLFMRKLRKALVLLSASAFAFALLAHGQDSPPSLGDVARQSRLQKQQKDSPADKDTQSGKGAQSGKDAQSSKDAQSNVRSKDTQNRDAEGKDATAKDAPAKQPHVITNDEIPSHLGPTEPSGRSPHTQYANYPPVSYGNGQVPAEAWKAQFQAMKASIASLQNQITSLNDSIHYAGGNCISGCVQWNERQKQKQEQVEAMKAQLEQMQKRMEDMQEAARRQGYGSSVYDP
jgi:hypothetical protein